MPRKLFNVTIRRNVDILLKVLADDEAAAKEIVTSAIEDGKFYFEPDNADTAFYDDGDLPSAAEVHGLFDSDIRVESVEPTTDNPKYHGAWGDEDGEIDNTEETEV